jgi:hypothetical protein
MTRPPRRWLTGEEEKQALYLLDEGWTPEDVAKDMGVAKVAVTRLRQTGFQVLRPGPELTLSERVLALAADDVREDEARIDSVVEEEMFGNAGRPASVQSQHKLALGWLARHIARDAAEEQMRRNWWELSLEQKLWWVRVAIRFVLAQERVLARGVGKEAKERVL